MILTAEKIFITVITKVIYVSLLTFAQFAPQRSNSNITTLSSVTAYLFLGDFPVKFCAHFFFPPHLIHFLILLSFLIYSSWQSKNKVAKCDAL